MKDAKITTHQALNTELGIVRTADNTAVVLRVADFAELMQVNQSTVWRWTRQGVCPPPRRIAGTTRWLRADIEQWMAGGCVEWDPAQAVSMAEVSYDEAQRNQERDPTDAAWTPEAPSESNG